MGVQLNTGGMGANATPVTFNIDSFSINPPLHGRDRGRRARRGPRARAAVAARVAAAAERTGSAGAGGTGSDASAGG